MSNPDFARSRWRPPQSPNRSSQRGVSLVELLVGLTIGLLAIMVAIGTLILSRGVAGSVSDMSQLQQQGSFALRVIGTQLRQAGSVDLQPSPTGVPGSFQYDTALPPGFNGGSTVIQGTDGNSMAPDTLSVGNLPSSTLVQTQAATA